MLGVLTGRLDQESLNRFLNKLDDFKIQVEKDTSSSTNLDVKSADSQLLASCGDILSSQHGGIRRTFISISLDFHSACISKPFLNDDTCDSDDGFFARQICDMDKGIVEGSEYVGNTKHEFTFSNLRTESGHLFFGSDFLLWRLFHCN
jgi:hypothetical protein